MQNHTLLWVFWKTNDLLQLRKMSKYAPNPRNLTWGSKKSIILHTWLILCDIIKSAQSKQETPIFFLNSRECIRKTRGDIQWREKHLDNITRYILKIITHLILGKDFAELFLNIICTSRKMDALISTIYIQPEEDRQRNQLSQRTRSRKHRKVKRDLILFWFDRYL